MSTKKQSRERPRIVCNVDASWPAADLVRAASSYCRRRDAELVIAWVLDPSSLRSTVPSPAGATGTWSVLGAVAVALGIAHKEGIAARAVVRIGDADKLLDEERRAVGAERVFTRADCAAEPPVHLRRSQAVTVESDAA